jgi:hypothetical protein
VHRPRSPLDASHTTLFLHTMAGLSVQGRMECRGWMDCRGSSTNSHLCMTASSGDAACPRSGAAGPHSPALTPLRVAAVPLETVEVVEDAVGVRSVVATPRSNPHASRAALARCIVVSAARCFAAHSAQARTGDTLLP